MLFDTQGIDSSDDNKQRLFRDSVPKRDLESNEKSCMCWTAKASAPSRLPLN